MQQIKTDMEFQRDMLLMFQNAFMYNNTEHEVSVYPSNPSPLYTVLTPSLPPSLSLSLSRYFMAQEMRNDVMENIQVSPPPTGN